MKKVILGIFFLGLFYSFNNKPVTEDEEIIQRISNLTYVLNLKTKLLELKRSFDDNLISRTKEGLNDFKRDLADNHDKMIEKRDFFILRKYLKSPEEYLKKQMELIELLKNFPTEVKEYNNLSQNGKTKFIQSLSANSVVPLECIMGFAAGIGGCAGAQTRCINSGMDPLICDMLNALCFLQVTIGYDLCVTSYPAEI